MIFYLMISSEYVFFYLMISSENVCFCSVGKLSTPEAIHARLAEAK